MLFISVVSLSLSLSHTHTRLSLSLSLSLTDSEYLPSPTRTPPVALDRQGLFDSDLQAHLRGFQVPHALDVC